MLERKFYGERVRRYIEKMGNVLHDAYGRMDRERDERGLPAPEPAEVNIMSWPQTWPDARCGFEKPLRDVYPTEQTNVVRDEGTGAVYVYHAGHFAKEIEHPPEPFWDAVRAHALPGATDAPAWQRLLHPPAP